MSMRHTLRTVAVVVVLVLAALLGIAFICLARVSKAPVVRANFLSYTNSAQGGLLAVLEIQNQSEENVACDGLRISPEPSGEKGFWYAVDVPPHLRRLKAGETGRLVVSFRPQPMTRWRATIRYVWNPSEMRFRAMRSVDWLGDRGLAPASLRDWRDRLNRAESSTDWITFPASGAQ